MADDSLILKVDLDSQRISKEPLPAKLREQYLGGEGINARLLWEHFQRVSPNIGPLSPNNVLIAGAGPMVGTCFGTGAKMKFTYKSPAYNIYGDTSVGGNIGSQLRWAGYEHIVITGRAQHPMYLAILDDRVELRDARAIWGKTVPETDGAIKAELGDEQVETACIGPAGENLVRVASIMASRHRAAGRGGGGCVMGSKNLKAIAARGTKGIRVHDPKALLQASAELQARLLHNPATEPHMRYGTLITISRYHVLGFNSYRNMQGQAMPDDAITQIDHNWYNDNIGVRPYACSTGCTLACGHWHHVNGNESPAAQGLADTWGTRPEYGAANPFGSSCDCRDLIAVAHFNSLCNEYGMDVMEIGMTISFLMELWERGIINASDTREWTGGKALTLQWGNQEAMGRIIEAVALKQGKLGTLLNGGVYQTAVRVGELKGIDLLRYANYGKGGATHEGPARSKPPLSLACALSSIGAHHLKGLGVMPATSLAYFGTTAASDPLTWELKGPGHAIGENTTAVGNSLGLCRFSHVHNGDEVPLELIGRAFGAVTGVPLDQDELSRAGERVVNIQKAFNSRLGLRREHDTLCHRWLNEPQQMGAAKGNHAGPFLEPAKDEYYKWRGWDQKSGLQTKSKLEELDMADVAAVLEKDGALVAEVAV